MDANCIFPDPKCHFTGRGELDIADFDRVCHRFDLIKREMQSELDGMVKTKLLAMLEGDVGSDSTRGLSDREIQDIECLFKRCLT